MGSVLPQSGLVFISFGIVMYIRITSIFAVMLGDAKLAADFADDMLG